MKSMLHEASSVAKAIEKAWVASGKPEKFSINILESGKKSFFGFITDRPAIVSITFDPKKSSNDDDTISGKNRKNVISKNQSRSDNKRSSILDQKNQRPIVHDQKVRDLSKVNTRQVNNELEKSVRTQNTQISQNTSSIRQDRQEKVDDMWTAELVAQIKEWLKELCSLMGISIPAEMQINKKNLLIVFQGRIIAIEDERALYYSFSYLLMQFLKKYHKKKFHNCHIVISTKDSGANDKLPDNSQE